MTASVCYYNPSMRHSNSGVKQSAALDAVIGAAIDTTLLLVIYNYYLYYYRFDRNDWCEDVSICQHSCQRYISSNKQTH